MKQGGWGEQVNEIKTGEGWKYFKDQAAKQGLIYDSIKSKRYHG